MRYLLIIAFNCTTLLLFRFDSNAQAAPSVPAGKTITAPAEEKAAVPADVNKNIMETDKIPASRKEEFEKAEREAYKLPPGAPTSPSTQKENGEKKKEAIDH